MGLSNDLSCEAGSLSCCRPNPHGRFQIRGLRLYFPELEPWVTPSASVPDVHPGLSVHECGVAGSASGWTACPILRHSESSPLGLSVCECGAAGSASGRTACPRSSHTPPVSVPPRQRESSPPRCPSPLLLPVWMNVYFLSPWCRTSLPFDFLSVLVEQGGAVCLPTPPSWFSQSYFQCSKIHTNLKTVTKSPL